jgi:FKBP-type peptidyl-prolyl cis-trans isomerase SlyD
VGHDEVLCPRTGERGSGCSIHALAEVVVRVTNGKIISIEYQVTLSDGEVVESTPTGAPVQYLHGAGMLLPSLEAALENVEEGNEKRFILSPQEAYGERDESSVVTLPRGVFPSHVDLSVGARLAARTTGGELYPLTVREIHADRVVVDLNHPLAGKSLHFDVRVCSVRSAGNEEVFTGKPRPIEIV